MPHQTTESKPAKRNKVLTLVLIILGAALAVAIAATVFFLQPGDVSRQEAMDIAIAHVGGGHANWAERDFEDFTRVWSVEVFYDGLVHEVFISRFSGEIVRVEIDRWD